MPYYGLQFNNTQDMNAHSPLSGDPSAAAGHRGAGPENDGRMMENHRELNADETVLLAQIDNKRADLVRLVGLLQLSPDADQRWVSIGKTHLQMGLMFLARAVWKPEVF